MSINENQIILIETGSFYNVSYLTYLNLSNNPIFQLPELILQNSVKMKLLYITNVTLSDIHIKALQDLHVNVIITTEYHLCCISSCETLCPASKPWYLSCSDILPNGHMKPLYI